MTTEVTENKTNEVHHEEKIKRSVSLRSDTVVEGHIYDFEIYKNGGQTVLRSSATIVKNPGFHIRDYGPDDAMVIHVEGEEEPRMLVKSPSKPHFLITRMEGKRNCRIRFHKDITPVIIDKESSDVEVEIEPEEKELVEA